MQAIARGDDSKTIEIAAGASKYPIILSYTGGTQSLNDMKIRVGYGLPIDKGVERLLKALIFYGIDTKSSCDGGLEHRRGGINYGDRPWVEIRLGQEQILQPIIDLFNEQSKIRWMFLERGLFGTPLTTEHTAGVRNENGAACDLKELVRSSEALADFIFNASIMELKR